MARNWGTVREWANVAVAAGSLLVGVVSFWTTARISGLEDYLRSEIQRRNGELNSISAQARQASANADNRAQALERLQAATETITASTIAAQGKLIAAQNDLQRTYAQAADARDRVSRSKLELDALNLQSTAQMRIIDIYRRQRIYEQVSNYHIFRFYLDDKTTITGRDAVNFIIDMPEDKFANEVRPYLFNFKERVGHTCKPVEQVTAMFVDDMKLPPYPNLPGRKDQNDSGSHFITKSEQSKWEIDQKTWSDAYSRTLDKNRKQSSDRLNKIKEIMNGISRCTCLALANSSVHAEDICPGVELN